jgi:hypothetical protein
MKNKTDPRSGPPDAAGNFDLLIYTFFPGIQVFSEKRLAFPRMRGIFIVMNTTLCTDGILTRKGPDT